MLMNGTPKLKPSRAHKLVLDIQYAAGKASAPTSAQLRRWTRAALRGDARITLRIIGAREARTLNKTYRQRDYATNVLSFPYEQKPLMGDIAICAPVVIREARELGISSEARYAHLTVHGVLHLQGFDHLIEREALRMERMETAILDQLGYSDPYAADEHE